MIRSTVPFECFDSSMFWCFRLKGRGTWSQEGCRLYQNGSKYESESDQVSESTITCECDHLTTFAVIQRKIPATKVILPHQLNQNSCSFEYVAQGAYCLEKSCARCGKIAEKDKNQ